MRSTIIRSAVRIAAVAVLLLVGAAAGAAARHAHTANRIKARVGAYTLAFTPKSGAIAVSHGGSAVLQIRELGGGRQGESPQVDQEDYPFRHELDPLRQRAVGVISAQARGFKSNK